MILNDLTMTEFADAKKRTRTLIVPFGTVEAHGKHLPLNTDSLIIDEVAKEVTKKIEVFVAPTLQYGVCTSTSMHPGTIGITAETLRRITTDIVRDSYAHGLRRFILVSGHGGGAHVSAMKEASEALSKELPDITIAAFAIYEILPKEARLIAETKNDSHAGEIETSLVLYLQEELVKGRASEEYPKLPKPIIARNKLKYWPGAVWGNPEKASKEKGEKFFDIMVESLVGFVGEIDNFKED